jgi:hypothetical protein
LDLTLQNECGIGSYANHPQEPSCTANWDSTYCPWAEFNLIGERSWANADVQFHHCIFDDSDSTQYHPRALNRSSSDNLLVSSRSWLAGLGRTVQLYTAKFSWNLGEGQDTWTRDILNLRTEEEMDCERRHLIQVGSLSG